MTFTEETLNDLDTLANSPAAAPSELRKALIELVREARRDKLNPPEPLPVDVMISALSQIVNGPNADVDLLDMVGSAADTYTGQDYLQVMLSFDLCPVHRCDAQICADDQQDCPVGKGEA